MSHPYGHIKDAFENDKKPMVWNGDPDEDAPDDYHEVESLGEWHHDDCECGDCMYIAWCMKN